MYVPSYESYGQMWPHLHSRLIAALLLYQLTMAGFFGVMEFMFAPFMIPLPIISLIFEFVCREKFYRFFQHPALEPASKEIKETPNMEQIFRSYIPPYLNYEKADDEQFEDALSQVSKTGSTV